MARRAGARHANGAHHAARRAIGVGQPVDLRLGQRSRGIVGHENQGVGIARILQGCGKAVIHPAGGDARFGRPAVAAKPGPEGVRIVVPERRGERAAQRIVMPGNQLMTEIQPDHVVVGVAGPAVVGHGFAQYALEVGDRVRHGVVIESPDEDTVVRLRIGFVPGGNDFMAARGGMGQGAGRGQGQEGCGNQMLFHGCSFHFESAMSGCPSMPGRTTARRPRGVGRRKADVGQARQAGTSGKRVGQTPGQRRIAVASNCGDEISRERKAARAWAHGANSFRSVAARHRPRARRMPPAQGKEKTAHPARAPWCSPRQGGRTGNARRRPTTTRALHFHPCPRQD